MPSVAAEASIIAWSIRWPAREGQPRRVGPLRDLQAYLAKVVARCRTEDPSRLIEIEVDNLEQLTEVLKVDGVQVILLDNMDCRRWNRRSTCETVAAKKA